MKPARRQSRQAAASFRPPQCTRPERVSLGDLARGLPDLEVRSLGEGIAADEERVEQLAAFHLAPALTRPTTLERRHPRDLAAVGQLVAVTDSGDHLEGHRHLTRLEA